MPANAPPILTAADNPSLAAKLAWWQARRSGQAQAPFPDLGADHLRWLELTRRGCRWVFSNIAYQAERGDHWQTPSATLKRRTGDCEDMALLLLALLQAHGVPASALTFAVEPGLVDHAVLLLDDERGRRFRVCPVTNRIAPLSASKRTSDAA